MFPDNVVAAAVDMNILGVITFSLFFGLCLSQLGEEADGLISGIQACGWLVWFGFWSMRPIQKEFLLPQCAAML